VKPQHRIGRLRQVLKQNGLDALLVSSLHNIRYLTGFSGSHALCIIRESGAYFLTDSRYSLQSGREVKCCTRMVTARGLAETAAQQRLLAGCRRVGFESHHLSYAQYRLLRRLFPKVPLVPTSALVESLALAKDKDEVASIRTAVKISDAVFDEVLKEIRPGIRESEIAAMISYLHRKHGGEQDAFETIVASGTRGSLPHARASGKRIRTGELVTLDFGCRVNGYHSDITRTIGVGRVPRRAKEIYAVVLDAQRAAIGEAKAGMLAKDLDAVARKRIGTAGYGKYFIHSLGHGLGLHVHERPRISRLSKDRLVCGSVVTIEPGVYIPGFGGVRIEDDVLLTEKGCRVLNKAPKQFISV
jgi:Xaa-Pro aminopeptidase